MLKKRNGEVCGQSLSSQPFHPEACKCGAAGDRSHRRLEKVLQQGLESAGGEVDLERIVPELAADKLKDDKLPKDARMDLAISWPGQLQQQWIDVSIRSPHSQHAGPSARVPGSAAREGRRTS